MKKNDHVEFTGKIPAELSKAAKPIYGTIEKIIGKTKAEVKPRYKRFTVVVPIEDLTEIPYEKFHKKQRYPNGRPEKTIDAGVPDVLEEETPVSEPMVEEPKSLDEVVDQQLHFGEADSPDEPSFTPTPDEPVLEVQEPVIEKQETFCDEIKTHKSTIEDCDDPVTELTKEGNTMTYIVIGIIAVVVGAIAYFTLF